MNNQITTMEGLKEKISEQVKVSIFNLLPDDKIAGLVESEINAFFEEPGANYWAVEESNSSYYGNKKAVIQAKVSPFRLLVWKQLSKHLDEQIEALFQSPEFTSRCVIGDGQVKEDIQQAAMTRQESIALGMASAMFNRMVSESLMNASGETRSALQVAVRNVMIENGQL